MTEHRIRKPAATNPSGPLTVAELEEFLAEVRAAGAADDTPVKVEVTARGRARAVAATVDTATRSRIPRDPFAGDWAEQPPASRDHRGGPDGLETKTPRR